MGEEVQERSEIEDRPSKQEETPKDKKKIPLLKVINSTLIVLAILGLISTVISSFILTVPDDPQDLVKKSTEKKQVETIEEVGNIFALEPFVVNLLDFQGRRFLKTTIELETEETDTAEIERKLPYIRNIIINVLSNKTFDMIKTVEGKDKIRQDIVLRLNEILAKTTIKNCYFTEFTSQ